MKHKVTPHHDLRHPVSGKFIPKPENLIRKLVAAKQAQQTRAQAIPAAARLGGGAGILPLLMALRQSQGQGQAPQAPQQGGPPMMPGMPPQQ